MIQVLQKFAEPWGIIENDVSKKKCSQRQEKHNEIGEDNADGQNNSRSGTHDFLQEGLSE
jgi:hypothetical protein